jgi:twitching motility protein PilT
VGRCRCNITVQNRGLDGTFRLIPESVKTLDDLHFPPVVKRLLEYRQGLILVTGQAGCGKTTTLSAMIKHLNERRRDHIITLEDPIEIIHHPVNCHIIQREVGIHTRSFARALRACLREDPDLIIVGEMRDLETISVALTAAETGHLVYATLHTQDAAQTIDRVIDVFPPHQQQQVRAQLATAIQGVVCQTLARTVDGKGRVVACEVLVATPAIRNLIREGKTHQIYSAMQAGSKFGMQTMDQHLADLVNKGRITHETGIEKCHHVEDFNRLTGRG